MGRDVPGERREDMNKRKRAYNHLQTVGNFIKNEDTGRSVERVDMVGGKYLTFDKHGNVSGFKNFNECMKYIGL